MRKAVLFGTAGLAGAALLALVLWNRREASKNQAQPGLSGALSSPIDMPALQRLARSLPETPVTVDAQEIRALLREAAEAHRAGDKMRAAAAYRKITQRGSAIQRLLAELLLDLSDAEERRIAAQALRDVATAEIAPFAVALVRSSLPDEIKMVAVELLAKFRVAEAAPLLETLLFQEECDAELKRRVIAYFAEMGGVEVLARVAGDGSFGTLCGEAAKGLAKIGTPRAARLLLDTWRSHYGGAAQQYLLRALASFQPEVLRGLVREFLTTETDSAVRSVFLSMLGRADPSLAVEILKEILGTEKDAATRRQAILTLGNVKSAEAQEMLLELLASSLDAQEVVESVNALLHQDRLFVSFDKMRKLYDTAADPMLRVALAGLLTKYDLAGDPALVAALQQEAKAGMGSQDLAVRGLSLNLAASLARYGTEPAGALVSLYQGLSKKEQGAYPVVFQELSKQVVDPRVRSILETTLADPGASEPNRLMAADALFHSGATEPVYAAIGSSPSPEMTSMLTALALTRGGESAAPRLQVLAEGTQDPQKKSAITDQLRAWSEAK